CDYLDFLMLHTNMAAENAGITEAVDALHSIRDRGLARAIGVSPVLDETAIAATQWADVLMIELNPGRPLAPELAVALAACEATVFVKKALGSGHFSPADSLRFAFSEPAVDSVVIGSLSETHLRENL